MKYNTGNAANAAVGLLIGTAAVMLMAAVPQADCARSAPQYLVRHPYLRLRVYMSSAKS